MKMEAAANVWGIGNGLGEGVKGTSPQILIGQFTLSQPWDTLCPLHYYLPHPLRIFRTSHRPECLGLVYAADRPLLSGKNEDVQSTHC